MRTLPFQQTQLGCRVEGVGRWEVEAGGVPVGVQVTRPRAVPWLRLVRVPRFGRGLDPSAVEEAVTALARLARERPVLRLHLEAWTEKEEERQGIGEACRSHGFGPSPSRSYTRTVWLDLRPPEEEILAGFHATGRRHIRAPGKKGYEVRPVSEPAAVPALERLFHRTFRRTGGTPPRVDWALLVREGGKPSSRHHLVGLFPVDAPDQAEPLSFALALLHGEVAEYGHAASVRDPDVRIPLLYAPTWELMRWAKSRGASFWDFGGITAGSADDDDPVGGISDFKRYFGTSVRRVGEEWRLTPRPLSSGFADVVARLAGMARRMGR